MSLLSRLTVFSLGACAALLGNAAHADISAHAGVSQLHFELHDLDLSDQITPSITFDPNQLSKFSRAALFDDTPGIGYNNGSYLREAQLNSSHIGYSRSNADAQASYIGGTLGEAYASGHSTPIVGSNDRSGFEAIQNFSADFVLQAKTSVTFYGHLEAGLVAPALPASQTFDVMTESFIRVDMYRLASQFQIADVGFRAMNEAKTASDGQDFALTITNNTDTAQLGNYFTYASVNSSQQPYVAQVPEPETYAMLGAGLLALGSLTRRRHSLRKTG